MSHALKYPKPERKKDAAYLRFVRREGCIVPRCGRYADAHHVYHGGVATKGHDRDTVGLCGGRGGHHDQIHSIGRTAFEMRHGLNLDTEIQRLREKYGKGC